ncbi:MAG: response regulator [Acidobacteria bacterium]|nr:response regulator [Acidobacteriota bacterium]
MRVLTVDDSRTILAMLHHTLSNAGFTVLQAEDGQQGLDVLEKENVDIVITDINMPVMDGLKLVSLVRQNDQLRNIPIVIITTEGAEEDRERGLALGANAYISKPIQSSHLIKTISELLPV